MKISFDTVEMPSVDGMTSEQKFWFASAIAGMVGADGHAEKHELDYLKGEIGEIKSLLKQLVNSDGITERPTN